MLPSQPTSLCSSSYHLLSSPLLSCPPPPLHHTHKREELSSHQLLQPPPRQACMRCMAQEGSEASVASSPPPPHPPSASSSASSAAVSSWWRDMHPTAYAPWQPPSTAAAPRWPPMSPAAAGHHQHHHGRTTSSGAEDDLSASNATMTSFTNTSTNHSGLSMDSSVPDAADVAAESHLWNQVLMGAGGEVGRSMQAVHDAHDDSENFLELLNSRTLAPELFAEPPACDYLKKMEYGSSHGGGGWPEHHFTAAALEKNLSSGGYGGALVHQHHHHHHGAAAARERLTANLSDLVSNWSIAPPNPCLGDAAHHRAGATAACDNAMGHGDKAGFFLDSVGIKHEMSGHGAMMQETAGAGGQEFVRPPMGLGYSAMLGLSSSSRMYGTGAMDVAWGNNAGAARSLSDLISFGGALGKPEPAAAPAKMTPAEYKKQGQEIPSPVKTSSGGGGGCKGSSAAANEGKKKRSEEQQGSEGNAKKSKNEQASSPTSSLKSSQVPKVKLGDKITALQQIVSPFGKTDTASVLYEAINYIKWLHEQVQLLSDPYMKTSSSNDYNTWGGLDRKEKSEAEIDLRSRGLCLVPVSCTPQVYRDNNGPDYWTPPYRSCLYR